MEQVIQAVETIRTRYTAVIGDNFRASSLAREKGNTAHTALGTWEYVPRSLDELEMEAHPFTIPADIRFFEEHYGGLDLQFLGNNFTIYGCGSGENYDYPSIIQDFGGDSRYRDGWLEVGELHVVNKASTSGMDVVRFNSEVAGKVQAGAIITTGVNNGVEIWEQHQQPYLVVAASFTAWLQRIAANEWAPFL